MNRSYSLEEINKYGWWALSWPSLFIALLAGLLLNAVEINLEVNISVLYYFLAGVVVGFFPRVWRTAANIMLRANVGEENGAE